MATADDTTETNYSTVSPGYGEIRTEIAALLQAARAASVRSVNALMTATYWEIGSRIVEFEQKGDTRAEYGEELIKQLSGDLTWQFGRGFGALNLSQMRRFYMEWPPQQIFQTLSKKISSASGAGCTVSVAMVCLRPPAPGEESRHSFFLRV